MKQLPDGSYSYLDAHYFQWATNKYLDELLSLSLVCWVCADGYMISPIIYIVTQDSCSSQKPFLQRRVFWFSGQIAWARPFCTEPRKTDKDNAPLAC